MYKKVIIMAALVLLLVFVTQSQLHAESKTYEITGILQDAIFNFDGPSFTAFCLKGGKTRMIVIADVPREIALERGKMCVVRYAEGDDGFYHFLSIEYKSDVTNAP